ncbi:hypothetical protein [Streptomyces sp. PsTaAH-124]|uniref:hypothetical protein n=1 Tax=Streptomyces sp. PsTaAH-124 TaxID=1157638 RepID=UPI0003711F3A|nr:hypothetical protein [Streptomyces sp. PsTaAH-124]
MSTTRHHINRQRRRQARGLPPETAAAAGQEPARSPAAVAVLPARTASPGPDTAPGAATGNTPRAAADTAAPSRRTGKRRPSRNLVLAVLCLLTLVLGGFAGWAHGRAQSLRDDPAVRNTALTDPARTSEIKTQTEKAVTALFSYDHAAPAAYDKAVRTLLTGKAVAQHRALLDAVRTRADQQKAVITTTVTDSAVERIDGDRARVLVYADQSSVSTAGTKDSKDTKNSKNSKGAKGGQQAQDQGTYAGAMFAVDVVLSGGRWLVSGIDTFGR